MSCEICEGDGRIAKYHGEVIYCTCRAGTDAELEDLSKKIVVARERVGNMTRSDPGHFRIWQYLQILSDQRERLERARYQRGGLQ